MVSIVVATIFVVVQEGTSTMLTAPMDIVFGIGASYMHVFLTLVALTSSAIKGYEVCLFPLLCAHAYKDPGIHALAHTKDVAMVESCLRNLVLCTPLFASPLMLLVYFHAIELVSSCHHG